jgi:hypothetical protein
MPAGVLTRQKACGALRLDPTRESGGVDSCWCKMSRSWACSEKERLKGYENGERDQPRELFHAQNLFRADEGDNVSPIDFVMGSPRSFVEGPGFREPNVLVHRNASSCSAGEDPPGH